MISVILMGIPGGEIAMLIPIILFAFLIAIIPNIFYMLTLQNTLMEVSEENRTMPPTNVWLLFIPLFALIWHFFVIDHMANSIQNELNKRQVKTDERPGYNIGLAMCILNCCSVIPFLGGLAAIAGLICWIIYWVKIADFKRMLSLNVTEI